MRPEGNRILVKGDPGIGKTTFTHEVAHDWATGNLPQFDLVLVLKLKFSTKHQTIENMVAEQLQSISDTPNPAFSDSAVRSYLRSGKDRILLILDGLDEIKLKEYPHVLQVLRGEAYRKCCILATTRPHDAASLHIFVTSVAKILGFSREKAEEFTSHIIPDMSERKQFFEQMDERGMSQMASIPILVQALALLFRENKQLPENYKTTYDDLVSYLRKTCEDSKGLTEEEIREAMDEISELAFRGLARDDRQLVFSRDEIQNENIMKLGLLAAEKSGTGFRPTTTLYFLHTTLQEYCASDHVTKGIEKGHISMWEVLVQDFPNEAERASTQIPTPWPPRQSKTEPTVDSANGNETVAGFTEEEVHDGNPVANTSRTSSKEVLVQDFHDVESESTQKPTLWPSSNGKDTEIRFVDKPVDETSNKDPLHVVESRIEPRCALNNLSISDARLVLRKIHPQFTKNGSRHENISLLRKMNSLLTKNDLWIWRGSRRKYMMNSRVSALSKLLEKLNEPLFIFIIGKLSFYSLELIIAKITELIIAVSSDETTGSMLYLHNIREGIEEYFKGKRPQSENTAINDILIKNPALIDFTPPFKGSNRDLKTQTKFAALRVTGSGEKDDSNFLHQVNQTIKTLSNIHSAELDDLSLVVNAEVRTEFIDALFQSSLVCLEVFEVDPLVTKDLLEKRPESVRYLSICQSDNDTIQTERFRLLPAENLTTLSLENCVIDFSQASFPNLKQLIIDRVSVAPENNADALVAAVCRMPKLEYLGMYHCQIASLGHWW